MTISLEISEETKRLCEAVREWGVNDVRPLAREADTAHGSPVGWEAVIDRCPANISPVLLAALPQLPPRIRRHYTKTRETGYVLGALLMEAQAYGDSWPLIRMQGAGIGQKVVRLLGTPEQKERWLPGEDDDYFPTTAFALTEAHFGSDPSQVATTATRDGDSWIINGSKMYCSNGASADFTVLFATVDKAQGAAGIRAFVATKDAPGYVVGKRNEHKLGIRSHETSQLFFDNMVLSADSLLGGDSEAASRGLFGALGTLNGSRPLMGAWALGIATASRDYLASWLAERVSEFTGQRWAAVQQDLRHMGLAIDEARGLVLRACWLADQDQNNRSEASAAKAYAPQVGEAVCRRVVEIMGAEGLSEEHLVEKWFRDVRIMDIFEGSGQIQRLMISRALLGRGAAKA